MEYSGAGGKLIHEKNQKQKISWHCPFKLRISSQIFEKIWNDPYGILRGWGKTIHEKPEV